MCFPTLFETPTVLHCAVSQPLPPPPPLVLGQHLAVVPRVPGQAPALVNPPALPAIKTGHHALAKFTPRPIEPCLALAGVLLYALPPVLTGVLTDPPLTAPALVASWTVTHSRGRTSTTVHTLWGAHWDRAGGSLPPWPADTAT